MAKSEKYMVIKTEDFARLVKVTDASYSDWEDVLIRDAWVIRQQDKHASVTAYAYASSVQNTIDILAELFSPDDLFNRAKHISELEKIRDAAFEYAAAAKDAESRLPD